MTEVKQFFPRIKILQEGTMLSERAVRNYRVPTGQATLSPSQQFQKYKISSSDPSCDLHIHTPMDMLNRQTTNCSSRHIPLCSYQVTLLAEEMKSSRQPGFTPIPSPSTCLVIAHAPHMYFSPHLPTWLWCSPSTFLLWPQWYNWFFWLQTWAFNLSLHGSQNN